MLAAACAPRLTARFVDADGGQGAWQDAFKARQAAQRRQQADDEARIQSLVDGPASRGSDVYHYAGTAPGGVSTMPATTMRGDLHANVSRWHSDSDSDSEPPPPPEWPPPGHGNDANARNWGVIRTEPHSPGTRGNPERRRVVLPPQRGRPAEQSMDVPEDYDSALSD
jgi:hypothetical protein